jgi:hypothetical protein
MTRTDLGRTVATLFCTLLLSATCVLGAVAPGHTGSDNAVAATRQVA